ncbi:hypothetical protein L3N13_003870 [Salmonella enterica]|nr:hypothetical protein [Salmonella enterica]
MTDLNAVLSDEVYQSFSALRKSVDALVCASDLCPDGVDDNEERLGYLFQLLSHQVDSDLTAFFRVLPFSRS